MSLRGTRFLGEVARIVSPNHRRWRRLLTESTLDPDDLIRPVPSPGKRDFIICGASRTGTTLASALLFQPPAVITAMEPWDGMKLPPAELFASLRAEVDESGRLERGKLDLKALDEEGAVRWRHERSAPVALDAGADYLLGVKWPAFWRYLELLPETRFIVCLRHPYGTISSFKRVGGRLSEGLDYEIAFNRRMNDALVEATPDLELRRVLLYEYVNSRILPHLDRPSVLPLKYESWFSEPQEVLEQVNAFLGLELSDVRPAIREPSSPEISERERTLIKEHCRSTEALGYEI
jgi:hypothetical protein